ncbi:MAG: hypothetical protein FJX77_16855, partial [Armatimonadetes bacterium]|nr:hypothetical protein [Armatimonadota bacterium]
MKPPRSLLSYLASVGCLLSATLYPAGAAQAGAGPAAPRRSRSTPPARAGRLDPAPASGNPSPAAGYRQPNPAEREQFRTALERRGWKAEIAVVPQSYSMPGPVDARGLRHSQPIGAQNATLFADVDGDRLPEWVVGYYFAPDPAAIAQPTGSFTLEEAAALLDERARLVVFKQDAEGAWQISWRSPGLGFEFAPPEFNLKEVNEGLDSEANLQLPLTLRDVDGDGRHEICFHCRSVDREVGELPGVYRYDGSRWVSVAPQADRFSLRDLNRDGKLEV